VISNPTHAPGAGLGQEVPLADRVLILGGVRTQMGANPRLTVIDVDIAIRNTANKPILNQPTYFELMGPESDGFAPRGDAADPFYGTMEAGTTRSGTVEFQIPAAAISGLRLLYRPEVATEAVTLLLNTR
jgi:hypothetical protein